MRLLTIAIALLLVSCGGVAVPTSSGSPTSPALVKPNTPRPVPSAVIATYPPAQKAVLSGSGSKSGEPVRLAGEYVLTDSVKLKPGYKWSVALEPGYGEVDAVSTDAAGTHSTTIDGISLEPAQYRVVVKAKKCGKWSVRLTKAEP